MKKLFASILIVLPLFAYAVESDIDPNGGETCAIISKNLRYRDRDTSSSDDVATLQDFLQSHGFLTSAPTGFFGQGTLQAVKKFQKSVNLSPTGYVGTLTRTKIQEVDCNESVKNDVSVPVTTPEQNEKKEVPEQKNTNSIPPKPMPPISSEVTQKVKCVFVESSRKQECRATVLSAPGGYVISKNYCTGVNDCVLNVSGEKGATVKWSSSCLNGDALTTVGGEPMSIKFDCKYDVVGVFAQPSSSPTNTTSPTPELKTTPPTNQPTSPTPVTTPEPVVNIKMISPSMSDVLTVGEPLNVQWENSGTTHAQDWIGIVKSGEKWTAAANLGEGTSWVYTNGLPSGTKSLVVPTTPGSYQFVYYVNNSTTQELKRVSFTVRDVTPEMYTPKPLYAPGETVSITWKISGSTTAKDWISFVSPGQTWKSGTPWFFTEAGNSGTKSVAAPSTPGTYDIVYFRNNSFVETGRSGNIVVSQ